MWTFEIGAWEGGIEAGDPDAFAHDAALVPLEDAFARLNETWWHGVTVRYLEGWLEPGSLVLQRWHRDGRVEELESVTPGLASDTL